MNTYELSNLIDSLKDYTLSKPVDDPIREKVVELVDTMIDDFAKQLKEQFAKRTSSDIPF